jgi:hypothetical protein
LILESSSTANWVRDIVLRGLSGVWVELCLLKELPGNEISRSERRQRVETSFVASWLKDSLTMISMSYRDQTLIGPAKNTSLERGVSFLYQRRWSL